MPGDIWAMGVSLFGMVFGYLPFKGNSIVELFDSIRDSE
jgi:serine/threonine protein kinase